MNTSTRWRETPALDALLHRAEDPLGRQPWEQPQAQQILQARYLAVARGRSETIDDLVARVARHVACAEGQLRARAIEYFAALMRAGAFLPNSPTLMNAGTPEGQLSACFVLPVGESGAGPEETLSDLIQVQRTGGGTGFSFSQLPPCSASQSVRDAGPLATLEAFDAATDEVRQSGRRRGANMGVLRADHPDVLRFITYKTRPQRLLNFNLSVALPETFWRAHEQDGTYPVRDPSSGAIMGQLRARQVLALIARAAWLSAEPGLLFLDTINRDNPTPDLGEIQATNPCGEQPLLAWESCTLGSLNLAWFLRRAAPLVRGAGDSPKPSAPDSPKPSALDDEPVSGDHAAPPLHRPGWAGSHLQVPPAAAARARQALERLDFAALGDAVWWAVRFLDDVLESTAFPLEPVAQASRATRKIGLGVMGFADLLIGLGIPYNAPEALAVADAVMGFVAKEARRASEALAAERGPFPAFAGTADAARGAPPRRNATCTSIAPTGTLSLLADCSPGIEPIFAPVYDRRMLEGARVRLVHPSLARALDARGLPREALLARMAERGTARLAEVPEDLARLFVSAHEVPPEHHVAVQAAFQRHVDSGVSKTVNLPADATPETVADLFELAHRLGCKGITVYRDGSRPGQVLQAGRVRSRAAPPTANGQDARSRPPREKTRETSLDGPHPCPDCGDPLEPMGPFRVCYRCAWSE